jgi:hypothetical protein
MSSTILSTPSYATAGPSNPPTTATMQAVCDLLDTDGAGTDYQVILTQGTVDHVGPVNDLNTIVNDESTRVADHSSASSPFGTIQYFGNAGRHGGSVNLFALSGYPGITYDGSFVDQNVDRVQTDTYNFTCQLQHYEIVGSHTTTTPGDPAIAPNGWYTNPGHPTWESEQMNTTICANGDGHPYGTSYGQCVFHPGPYQPAGPDIVTTVYDYGYANSGEATSNSLTDGPYYVDTVVYATHVSSTVDVTETNNAPYFAGDGVVCINPGKKGGTWTAKTGWTHPEQCNTTYFNTAPYISGANVFSSNSLPPL